MSENHLDLPISENHFADIGNSISDIGNPAWFFDIGKLTDLQISEIQFSDVGNSKWFSDIGKSVDLPVSENSLLFSDIGKSVDFPI